MSEADDELVHEAIGPDLRPVPAGAALAQGVLALVAIGVAPSLLGAMVDQHRLASAQIGVAAMLELVAMGLATGLAGAFLKPSGLRLIAAGAALALAAADLAAVRTTGAVLIACRGLAGLPEGLLLWITIAMIARTKTPERWAGVFFTGQVAAQLLLAFAFAVAIIPRFGGDGGLAALAFVALAALPVSLFLPDAYGPLLASDAAGGLPPPRGVMALFATVIFTASTGAVAIYLQPLAEQAGLSPDVARTALWASLGVQVLAGLAVTMIAGRVGYFTVFSAVSVALLIVWSVFAGRPAAPLFVGTAMFGAFTSFTIGPFLVPMTIDADPSRRAAVQSGGAQLLGAALGPLLGSLAVRGEDVHPVLWLAAVLLLSGLAMMAWLHFTHRPPKPETATPR